MIYQQVFQKFRELANLDDTQAEKYRWLCDECTEELYEMLAENGKTLSENRLSSVAAAMTLYRYTAVAKDSNVTSFKAGELTVGYGKQSESAKQYLQQSLKSIAPYLKDNYFVFRSVRNYDTSSHS